MTGQNYQVLYCEIIQMFLLYFNLLYSQYEDIGYFWTQIQNEVFLQLMVLLQHKEIST